MNVILVHPLYLNVSWHQTFIISVKVKHFEKKKTLYISAFSGRVGIDSPSRPSVFEWLVAERSRREGSEGEKREVVFARTTEVWRGGHRKSHTNAHKSKSPLDVFSEHCSGRALEGLERVVCRKGNALSQCHVYTAFSTGNCQRGREPLCPFPSQLLSPHFNRRAGVRIFRDSAPRPPPHPGRFHVLASYEGKFTLHTNDSLGLLTLFRGGGFNRWTPWTPLICLWCSFIPPVSRVEEPSVRGALILNMCGMWREGRPRSFSSNNSSHRQCSKSSLILTCSIRRPPRHVVTSIQFN